MTFTERLKEWMKNNGIMQKDIAEKVGVDKSYISAVINGRKTPYVLEKDEALRMLNRKKIRDIEDKFNEKRLIKQTREIANALGYELKIEFIKK